MAYLTYPAALTRGHHSDLLAGHLTPFRCRKDRHAVLLFNSQIQYSTPREEMQEGIFPIIALAVRFFFAHGHRNGRALFLLQAERGEEPQLSHRPEPLGYSMAPPYWGSSIRLLQSVPPAKLVPPL